MPTITSYCEKHGDTLFTVRTPPRKPLCRKCNVASTIKARRNNKARLVEELGGQCVVCGYKRYLGSLHFHHKNPATKESSVSQAGRSLAWMRKEAEKCVLLCANCHYEVEAGVTILGL